MCDRFISKADIERMQREEHSRAVYAEYARHCKMVKSAIRYIRLFLIMLACTPIVSYIMYKSVYAIYGF